MRRTVYIAGIALLCCATHAFAENLFTNGPLVTSPNGGTGAIEGQPLSGAELFPIGGGFNAATTGVGATHGINTAVADNFVVPASGWNLDTLTVYAFQTSQTTATITDIYVNLWTSAPYSADSPPPVPNPLPQPVLATPLHLAAGPGTFIAHRESGSSTNTVRPVFSYTVSLDGLPNAGVLPAGEYWMEWSMDGAASPSANVFVPLVTPRTSAFDLNARLFNSPFSGSPRQWFEGREGFIDEANPGRPYALAFELGGVALPEPAALSFITSIMLAARRCRRS